MNTKLNPVTLDLPDELIAELTITAHAKGMTLEEWVTLLVSQAMNQLTRQVEDSQTRGRAESGSKHAHNEDNGSLGEVVDFDDLARLKPWIRESALI